MQISVEQFKRLVVRHPTAHLIASGVWAEGRKPVETS
jgi:hypothetical protein